MWLGQQKNEPFRNRQAGVTLGKEHGCMAHKMAKSAKIKYKGTNILVIIIAEWMI